MLGCGIFGSVSGSSAATCATIAKIALPELKKRGYPEMISLGSLAGAGTLGILIPPSITMVIYAVAANVSILKVFLAGFLPGLLVMALYSGYIAVWALLNPAQDAAARAQDVAAREAQGIAQPHSLHAAHRAGVRRAADGLGDGDGMRGLGRARRAADRLVVGRAHLGELLDQRHGRHAPHLHDHADPGRRLVHVDVHGLHRHSGGAGGLGRRA